jgi:hypothetical protein
VAGTGDLHPACGGLGEALRRCERDQLRRALGLGEYPAPGRLGDAADVLDLGPRSHGAEG